MLSRHLHAPVFLALSATLPGVAADPAGEQLYKTKCATCHGPSGEGTKKHKRPLAGEKSVTQLTKLIAKTMPEDDPGTLSVAEADAVAAYVHDTFYSPAARERNKPPRVELSRLTVGQYRNAIADLIATFRPADGPGGDQHGLKAEYYRGRRFRPNDRVVERIDPEVRFDFGTFSPVPDKIEPHEFSVHWEGSLLAPETGDYEFVVRTEHAARLWVNEIRRPLIDAWVKSGSDTEYRGSVFLLAGRAYPLRLEFSKAKQGVDDSKKQKEKPPSPRASVALLWKLPGRVPEVIPRRNLSPAQAPEGFAVSTPFPPDDRSLGWERGTTVSKAWDQATTDAAIETAVYVLAHVDELAGVRPADREPGPGSGNPADINLDAKPGAKPAPDRDKKLREFAFRFAERAFRRPLTDDEKRFFVEHQFEAAKDPDRAVKRVVLLALMSPRFLYREAAGLRDGYEVANRLSFGLWDSPPDAELLKAA
ncbi:MAG TPA: PA14 domain-containing protein, partial [Gemmataceae bacterium]|nr:PA14 domain-containing protein [Gemmataceae bacterium]